MDKTGFHECMRSLSNNKSPGPDGIVNELLTMLPSETRTMIHMLLTVLWATGVTPRAWKTSDTVLIDKQKGPQTSLSSYRPVGLANTLYKLWTRLITNALYEYTETHSILSSTQAGFRKQKDTIHQLQNLIMALEDAKLFKQDIYALIIDFTSAFNTTDHDKMLVIMYELGIPIDAIDVVRNLYTDATTQIKLPSGGSTQKIPVERGTIQGDTLSPLLFLLYMEPLLRWLHVGGRGYTHGCVKSETAQANHLLNNLSSAAFADDLACLTPTLAGLHTQALKITQYSNWSALQISGSKTKVTGILYGAASTAADGQAATDLLKHQLADKVTVQNQKAQFLAPDAPFPYLGVELTMTLDFLHQHKRMTANLKEKVAHLRASYASPRQTQTVVRTAIISSLAYAFPVTPCTPMDLEIWDSMIGAVIKHKYGLW